MENFTGDILSSSCFLEKTEVLSGPLSKGQKFSEIKALGEFPDVVSVH